MDARLFLSQNFDEIFSGHRASGSFAFTQEDRALAERRLKRWKNSPPFRENPDFLARYLAGWGASERDLRRLLGAAPSELAALFVETAPDWWSEAKILFEDEASCVDDMPKDVPRILALVWPLLRQESFALSQTAERLSLDTLGLLDPFPVVDCLRQDLWAKISRLIQRTVVLEVNVARVENRLTGETPEERYESFLRSARDAGTRRQILLEYPLLVRDLALVTHQWRRSAEEFFLRLRDDRRDLGSLFGLAENSKLIHACAAGDAHRGGRGVLLLTFACGLRLAYKPRPVLADALFQDFLRWNNSQGQVPPLRTFKILDRKEYGWTEFVPFGTCETREELERFYARQGSLLALFYLLGGTDMHRENLVAAGEDPVVIDLETLFRPGQPISSESANAESILAGRLLDSVLSTGMLPMPTLAGDKVMDSSALGAERSRDAVAEVEGVAGFGTDEAYFAKVTGKTREILSQPSLRGVEAHTIDYRAELQRGFSQAYVRLQKNRATLLSSEGPLAAFRGATIRVVLRPSEIYATLLRESTHPKLLRNAFERELHFARIFNPAREGIAQEKIASAERRQLFVRDIPLFLTEPGSLDLLSGDGHRLDRVLEKSGWNLAEERITRLSSTDLAFQAWLIDAALYRDEKKAAFAGRRTPSKRPENFLAAARIVGDQLIETSCRSNGTVTWPGLSPLSGPNVEAGGIYRVGILDHGLYRGHAGIVLFFAHLAALTGEPEYRTLAEECLATMESQRKTVDAPKAIGAFSGLAGQIYTYTQLATLWGEDAFLGKAQSLLEKIALGIDQDDALDIISGSAGCVPVLLGLARLTRSDLARQLAIRCGDRILAKAARDEKGGLIWQALSMQRGFSHGLSGVAYALSELAADSKEDRFFEGMQRALIYERALLAEGIWADTPGGRHRHHWCHGASGIALSRLAIWSQHGDESALADAHYALSELTSADANPTASILCHGDLGTLEAWRAESEILRSRRAAEKLRQAGESILADFQLQGWDTKRPPHLAEPGLMTGLAGIGFGFLRFVESGRVPNVLLLKSASDCAL